MMTRTKYDLSGAGKPVLPPGVYKAEIVEALVAKSEGKDTRLELVLEVANGGEREGYKLYEFVNLENENTFWKLRELLEAVRIVTNGRGEKGTLDPERDLVGHVICVKTMIRPADEQRGYPESARVARMFELVPGDDSDDEDALRAHLLSEAGIDFEIFFDIADRWIEKQESRTSLNLNHKEVRACLVATLCYHGEFEAGSHFREAIAWMERVKETKQEYDLIMSGGAALEPEARSVNALPGFSPNEGDDYDEWATSELREELLQRDLDTTGAKAVLIARIRLDDVRENKPF
jgi:hypothetical protein